MSRLSLGLLAALLPIFCGCGGHSSGADGTTYVPSCPPLSTPVNAPGSIGSIVDQIAAKEITTQGLPGLTIEIAKKGKSLYSQAYGYADASTCRRADVSNAYQIGSITKQFTAAAVLQLEQRHELNIDGPVSLYLPNYAFDSRITLRMLLNQTSGLQDYLNFPQVPDWAHGADQGAVLSAIAAVPLEFDPGTAFAYSNSNYYLLGAIVEAVSGATFAGYLKAAILDPLGLQSTSLTQPSSAADPYVGIIPDPSFYFSAGALWSNVVDLTTWDAALTSGQVLDAQHFADWTTPPQGIPQYQTSTPTDYAMGWVRDSLLGRTFLWHNGQTSAYTAFNGVFADDGLSIAIVTNLATKEDSPLLDFAENVLQTVCAGASGRC
jgi:CubicO group peptidase (beta-lactamase class C family)